MYVYKFKYICIYPTDIVDALQLYIYMYIYIYTYQTERYKHHQETMVSAMGPAPTN